MEKALAISNYFIRKSQDTGVELSPLKLIKLCYLSHGWHLGIYDQPLLDEAVVAWKYGPVIETVYYNFKHYKDTQIIELYQENGFYPLPAKTKNSFLEEIWRVYGDWNGLELSTLTHQKNSPWDIVWNQEGGKHRMSAVIPNNIIKNYYTEKLKNQNNGGAGTRG